MNGTWDSECGTMLDVRPREAIGEFRLFVWTTGGPRMGALYAWHADWRSGAASYPVKGTAYPGLSAREHLTEEDARDDCIAWVQHQLMQRDWLVPAEPQRSEVST